MSQRIAKRLDGVSESATLKLNAAAQAMRARGEDVVNLTAGEPDFNVPDASKVAAENAIRSNKSKYTPVPGIQELRERVAKKTNAQQPSVAKTQPWTGGNVVVSNGGKQAIFNTLFALIDPGEEVLIPAPYWLSYPEMARLCGGVPVSVSSSFESGYKVTVADLKKVATPKSRVLILNSPSNPTGATYTREEFAAIGQWLLEDPIGKNIMVISDEIYDRILFTDRPFASFLESTPALRSRVITVNGMSKSAAMTGWRIGWTVADAWVTSAIQTMQGQMTSGINAIAQYASVAALDLPEADFAEQVKSFRERRDLTLDILRKAEKLKVHRAMGAFYAFVDAGAYLKPGEDSFGLAEAILSEVKVAVVPGTPFGAPTALRLSFATDIESLRKGCDRLVTFFRSRS